MTPYKLDVVTREGFVVYREDRYEVGTRIGGTEGRKSSKTDVSCAVGT